MNGKNSLSECHWDKAGETVDFVLPIVAGALEEGDERPVLVRMDAGVPDGAGAG